MKNEFNFTRYRRREKASEAGILEHLPFPPTTFILMSESLQVRGQQTRACRPDLPVFKKPYWTIVMLIVHLSLTASVLQQQR